MMRRLVLIGLGLLLALPAAAQQQRGPRFPHFMQGLYPPDLIMRQQNEIGLEPEQREVITAAIRAMQGDVLEIEWQLEAEQQKLGELLAEDVVDEAAALEQAERMMDLEQQVKLSNLGLLIQIRNTLEPEQRALLDGAFRRKDMRRRQMRRRPPTDAPLPDHAPEGAPE